MRILPMPPLPARRDCSLEYNFAFSAAVLSAHSLAIASFSGTFTCLCKQAFHFLLGLLLLLDKHGAQQGAAHQVADADVDLPVTRTHFHPHETEAILCQGKRHHHRRVAMILRVLPRGMSCPVPMEVRFTGISNFDAFILEQQVVIFRRRRGDGLRRGHITVVHHIPALDAHVREVFRNGSCRSHPGSWQEPSRS